MRRREKKAGKPTGIYQSQVSILGPVGYGPTTLPLRHSDGDDNDLNVCWRVSVRALELMVSCY